MPYDVVFVDIDTQADFMEPEGHLYVPGAEKIADTLERLLEFARERSIPVLASMDTHVPDDREFATFPPHCVAGTPGHAKISQTAPAVSKWVTMEERDVAPVAGETLLIEKHSFDVFENPNTARLVEDLQAKEYVVFGVATDYCVRAAALGLMERGQSVTVVSDCVRPVTPEGGEKALAEMQAAGARFATADEVIARLGEGA